jgi:hypothetical protein
VTCAACCANIGLRITNVAYSAPTAASQNDSAHILRRGFRHTKFDRSDRTRFQHRRFCRIRSMPCTCIHHAASHTRMLLQINLSHVNSICRKIYCTIAKIREESQSEIVRQVFRGYFGETPRARGREKVPDEKSRQQSFSGKRVG